MRRQSLRPRQIDIHARMRIIRSEEDLDIDDESTSGGGSTGGSSSQPTTTTFAELIGSVDDKLHAATSKPKRKKNIPIPVNLTVATYDDAVTADFVAPTAYVRFQTVPLASDVAKVDLDLEIADLVWLKQHPKYGDNGDPRYQLTPAAFAQMLDVLEKASALINPAIITLPEAEDVFATQLGRVKTPLNRVTVDVYNYWATKRQALKRPLLRKNWPQTPLNDTNPHLVFRPREKERYKLRKHRKNDMDGYRKLQVLRADCDRVRRLLALVKRRETLKRKAIACLDEMQTQRLFELTTTTNDQRRTPVIPVDADDDDDDGEDDSRKSRMAKKKKKKLLQQAQRDAIDSPVLAPAAAAATTMPAIPGAAAATSASNASASNASALDASSSHSPSFLDHDPNDRYHLGVDDADDLAAASKAPHFASFPLPTAHLLASVFQQQPTYRCRGRIGRGGRLVIDRIPVPSARYYGPTEVRATAAPTAIDALATAVATAAPPASATGLGEAINSGHHTAILIHETSFRPLAHKLAHVTTKRLEEIYGMSDSEDEVLERLTPAVLEFESATNKHAGSLSNSSNSNKTPAAAAAGRATKFAWDI